MDEEWSKKRKLDTLLALRRDALKERLLDALLAEGCIKSAFPMETGRGYHCSSCSCCVCRNATEDCVCDTNEILGVIEAVFSEPEPEREGCSISEEEHFCDTCEPERKTSCPFG